jgi:hypothetical protein
VTSLRFAYVVFNGACALSLECIKARSQASGFNGLAGQFSQVTNGAGFLHGAGLRLGPKCLHLLLEQIDYVLRCLQLPGKRCRLLAQSSRQPIHEIFHSPDALFDHQSSLAT